MKGNKLSNTKISKQAETILCTFRDFNIEMELTDVIDGLNAIYIRLKTKQPVRMHTIKEFEDDLCYALGIEKIEIKAPLRGTSLIGIEIPKAEKTTISWKDAISSKKYEATKEELAVPVGKNEFNDDLIIDIHKLPHLLVAGLTGSGKSAFLHNVINSLISRNGPNDLKLILSDNKRVEFSLYNGLPHLLTKPITEPRKTLIALKWLCKELERRFELLEDAKVGDIDEYHKKIRDQKRSEKTDVMPYIVFIDDEFSDVICSYPKEIENIIFTLTSMGRAVGIHLVLSSSRPGKDVFTGFIKAMFGGRMVFQLSSEKDSLSLLDMSGAEKIGGIGQMIFQDQNSNLTIKGQVAYISEDEIRANVKRITGTYGEEVKSEENEVLSTASDGEESDELYEEAKRIVVEAGKASTSYIQRKLRIGYARSSRLMDLLEENGIIGPGEGVGYRKALISKEELEAK